MDRDLPHVIAAVIELHEPSASVASLPLVRIGGIE